MAAETEKGSEVVVPATGTKSEKAGSAAPRKIPGNLPYLTAPGTLKKALDRLTEASQPPKFNADFLENVLKLKGGSARAIIPILKKTGLVTTDGAPTDLYAKFRTESGRGRAAYQALRNGFPEIFKRSEYAHTVPDTKLRDIIVEITGEKANDPVPIAIKGTFNVMKSYIPADFDVVGDEMEASGAPQEDASMLHVPPPFGRADSAQQRGHSAGLQYQHRSA